MLGLHARMQQHHTQRRNYRARTADDDLDAHVSYDVARSGGNISACSQAQALRQSEPACSSGRRYGRRLPLEPSLSGPSRSARRCVLQHRHHQQPLWSDLAASLNKTRSVSPPLASRPFWVNALVVSGSLTVVVIDVNQRRTSNLTMLRHHGSRLCRDCRTLQLRRTAPTGTASCSQLDMRPQRDRCLAEHIASHATGRGPACW